MLCLPKQFVYHLLLQLGKCNNIWDHLQRPNSPDLSRIEYKIWVIIQQRVQSTKVQDMKDFMQRLIDAWAGVEESVIQDVINRRRRRLHTFIQPQKDIMNIPCDNN